MDLLVPQGQVKFWCNDHLYLDIIYKKRIFVNKILVILLLTMAINANSVVGKILYAFDEEGVTPVIGLEIDGKEKYFIGSLKLSTAAIDKRKGKMIRAFLVKNNEIIKIKYLKKN